ncbi:multicopper oxidase family protein [Catellatospora sp. KI3]|uniref:multicopper oxidase family protein n=1 Tax=Catellatospora sp. KI3 TaxID=3041620 RepID=UPI002482FEB9|nr:multicopper oxidase family protein [Catellatospora sp. KI3]MDI1464776.1 multicopper oxidase family protein [Catellatospora sp. KI3]
MSAVRPVIDPQDRPSSTSAAPTMGFTRRSVLAAGVGGVGAATLAACVPPSAATVAPDSPQVLAVEADRHPGTVRDFHLTATMADVDLGGRIAATWCYNGTVPAPQLRVRAGEQVRARVTNLLPVDTSVHWHGVALRNDADGVPYVTQPPITPGSDFTYQFTAAEPGTYWLHPHTGVQADRGMYAVLIVEDPSEPLAYDDEWTMVLDDWTDGVAATPEQVFDGLRRSTMHHHMMGAAGPTSALLGGPGGDVAYPFYLLNGRMPTDPPTLRGRPGERIRLRMVNAAADTAFRVALGDHRLLLTHTDGHAVRPVEVDAVLLGMGERYDVLVTLGDGVFPLAAIAEGKPGAAMAVVRSGGGAAPPAAAHPAELDRRLADPRALQATERQVLHPRAPDRALRLALTGGMMSYDWGIDGRHDEHGAVAYLVEAGERVRVDYTNRTMMFHPMHFHGHAFALGATDGPRKDTVVVRPGETVTTLFDADNPGRWMIHCHNAYHAEAGMMALLGYRL